MSDMLDIAGGPVLEMRVNGCQITNMLIGQTVMIVVVVMPPVIYTFVMNSSCIRIVSLIRQPRVSTRFTCRVSQPI